MADPIIRAARVAVADDCEFGDDVIIEADEVVIGPGSRIGLSGADDFRTPPGVRIAARRFEAGAGVNVGRAVRIEGGDIRLGEGVRVVRHATIRVTEHLEVGGFGTVGEGCEISGREVRIGQELWMLPQAKIGGGSAFEPSSRLDAGHYLHLGVQTLVNTARPVTIGHEVGLGTRTSLYTHGAYPSRLMGFPVAFAPIEIGDFTWLPGAIVNPGVRIGRNCVIGVNSLVTKDIPDGSLAAGSPATVIRENAYPSPLEGARLVRWWLEFLAAYATLIGSDASPVPDPAGNSVGLVTSEAAYVAAVNWAQPDLPALRTGDTPARLLVMGHGTAGLGAAGLGTSDDTTAFDTTTRRIVGRADALSNRLANELRRYGVRFYSRPRAGTYVNWAGDPPSLGIRPEDVAS